MANPLVQVVSEVRMHDIAMELRDQLTHEELVEFLTTLDMLVGDWNFTRAAAEYFQKEMSS